MVSPSDILERRQFVRVAQQSPFWAMVNLSSSIICLIEMKFSFLISFSSVIFFHYMIAFLEWALMILFLVNFLYNMYLFTLFKRFKPPLELTEKEFTLYGIDPKEIGFKIKESKPDNLEKTNKPSHNRFPSTPTFDISYSFSNHHHSSLDSTALSTRLFNDSYNSQGDVKSNSWFFNPNDSLSKSFNSSNNEIRLRKSVLLDQTPNHSGGNSPVISSKTALEQYLRDLEKREEELQELLQAQKRYATSSAMINDQSPNDSRTSIDNHSFHLHQNVAPSFNQPPSRNLSFTNSPNSSQTNFQNYSKSTSLTPQPPIITTYQAAIKINSTPSRPDLKSESLMNSSHRTVENIVTKMKLTDDSSLNQMVENIRKWISQTILVRLVNEIESINKKIVEKGYIDSLIGETSIKHLKHLAEDKRTEFPTLEQVCPFLDIPNMRNIENNIPFQQYLVRRIKDLAKGGCMIEFLWDGGGTYNYKPWKEDSMITDSELIMHMFCVYMDSRLLFNPTIPEGKPFTNQYFKPYGGKMSMSKSETYIQQEKSYPPHFSLMLKGETFEIPPGRNNLFHSLLVFIHHIKEKNFGLLGRINLGPSGLNIVWVIEEKKKN